MERVRDPWAHRARLLRHTFVRCCCSVSVCVSNNTTTVRYFRPLLCFNILDHNIHTEAVVCVGVCWCVACECVWESERGSKRERTCEREHDRSREKERARVTGRKGESTREREGKMKRERARARENARTWEWEETREYVRKRERESVHAHKQTRACACVWKRAACTSRESYTYSEEALSRNVKCDNTLHIFHVPNHWVAVCCSVARWCSCTHCWHDDDDVRTIIRIEDEHHLNPFLICTYSLRKYSMLNK